MVTQSWSSIRSKENKRFGTKTWYLITMQSSKWPIHLMAFTSVIYLVSKILRQMLCCAGSNVGLIHWYYYHLMVVARHRFFLKYALETNEVHAASIGFEPRDWRFPIVDYTLHDILPDDPKEAASIQLMSLRFQYDSVVKILYRHSYDSILLHCLSNSEAQEVLKEAHDGICGAHQLGLKLNDRLHRLGYYWPTMIANAIKYAKKCKACQIHADFIYQPLELFHPNIASWLFEAWRIDVIGPISPPSTKGHRFILVITDYS